MSKTNWQDPGSSEILSTHISGLQEAVGKIEDAIGLQTIAETDVPLTEVYISDTDRYRIYQAPVGKRNWVASPAPVIKKNGVPLTLGDGFTIDYGGGAIILSPAATGSDVFTADVTRVNNTHSITPASIGAETPAGAQAKADAAEAAGVAAANAVQANLDAHKADNVTHFREHAYVPWESINNIRTRGSYITIDHNTGRLWNLVVTKSMYGENESVVQTLTCTYPETQQMVRTYYSVTGWGPWCIISDQASDGSPKGVYNTLLDLQTAYPTGTTGIFLVISDGKWYYWNGAAWTEGGVYQSSGLANGSVFTINLSDDLIRNIYNVYHPPYELGTIASDTGLNKIPAIGYGRMRTKSYLPNGNYVLRFINNSNAKYYLFTYNKDGSYVGTTGATQTEIRYLSDEYLYRCVIAYNDDHEFTVEDIPTLAAEIVLLTPKSEKKSISMDCANELVFKFDPSGDGAALSDHTFVKGELWVFSPSDDAHSTFAKVTRYKLDYENRTATMIGQFEHNFGHCNSVDYCEETDTLIFGNGSGDYAQTGVIYIIPNAYSLKDLTQADISTVAIAIDCADYNYGAKYNVVWGESNGGRYDICYLITDDNAQIRKLQLGKGSNDLGLGKLIEGKSEDEFNGTFRVMQLYTQDSQGLVNCIQGADYDRGYLYSGIGHDGLWIWKQKLCADGTVIREAQHERFYDETGDIISNAVEGVAINGDYIVIGVTPDILVLKR